MQLNIISLVFNGLNNPFPKPNEKAGVLFNDYFLILVTLHHFMLTDGLTQKESVKISAGYSLIFFTCLNFFINIGLLVLKDAADIGFFVVR